MEITNNDTKRTLSVAKLLSEVAKVKQYPEYPPMVENLLNYISESDGETCELETQMKEKILKALS